MPAGAARSSAASARSSTSRGGSRAIAARTTSSGSCGKLRPGDQEFLHHRRQLRAQPQLGADLRPADRAARRRGHPDQADHPGRHAVPSDSQLHREGRTRRRQARVHRPGEHQPGQSDRRRKKKQNRITEYRTMLQAWKAVRAITYCGYIIGFPNDTPESRAARHRDHQARAAGRLPRVLLPDAVARFGGPSDAAPGRRVDGPGSEQVRRRARHHRPPADVAPKSGRTPIAGPGTSTTSRPTSRR